MSSSTRIAPLALIALLHLACGAAGGADTTTAPGVVEDGALTSAKYPAGSTLRANRNVNLRTGPSTSNAIVEVIPNGDTVTLLAGTPSAGFFHVTHGDTGATGYSFASYFDFVSGPDATGGGGAGGSDAGGTGGGTSTADLAAKLQALTAGCGDVLSNGHYRPSNGEPATLSVCGLNGAIYFAADMDIDCDGRVTSTCNKSKDPDFQSDTSGHDSSGQPLDAAAVPFVVIPLTSSIWSYKSAGIGPGSVAAVLYQGKLVFAVVGDFGPSGIIGEASVATANALGINPSPTSGGVASGVTYVVFTGPGSKVSALEDVAGTASLGATLAGNVIGNN